jgi:CHAD domain-containing protein
MSFQLRQNESVSHGLQRLARQQLRSARDRLREATPPSDEAIHDARRSVKKVRAIVNLIDADEGRGLNGARKRLRLVNRTLSKLRDADVTLQTLTRLRKRHRGLLSEHTFARIRRQLSLQKQGALLTAHESGAWDNVDRELRNLRRDAAQWRPSHRQFGAVARGIRKSHRQGRKALARALMSQRADDFHEWRKQMKALWYQLRLIGGCSPAVRRDIQELGRAETALGEDHNLVVLCEQLSTDRALRDLGEFRAASERLQRTLRRRAIEHARWIYAYAPREYAQRVRHAWKSWKDDESAGARRRRRTTGGKAA